MARRLLAIVAVAVLLVAGGLALWRDQLGVLVALVGVGVIAGSAASVWTITLKGRALARAIADLDRRQARIETTLDELAGRLDEETGPLAPEHAEQLLRTVRASVARMETAQEQLAEQLTRGATHGPDAS